ncbi:transcriptional repressor [Candidatus Bathyarchaeota archaeon]|nr:transcriptional repressor [Candidatus Bathyarchaeota archaeon]
MQHVIAKLRHSGYKITPQRLEICELILSSQNHPTADQIYQKILRKFPTISLATVYQTLHLLKELGLLQELGFADMSSRYDPNTSPHVNVICPKCGQIYDCEPKRAKELWSQIAAELRFKPVGQRLDVYKYCDKCSNIQSRNSETKNR